jgi:phage-related minor tail protein
VRGPLPWILATVGVLAVIVVGAALAGDDEGETVSTGEWAQNVCGAVGVWRGEVESIVDDVRAPNAEATAAEEPQSETPQGRTGYIRKGLERSVQAAETLVEGIENAGVPDSPEGEEAAERMSEWADDAQAELDEAEEGLDDEAETVEESIEQLTNAARTVGAVLASGWQTIIEIGRLDQELAAALATSSTCRELREEVGE